MKQTAIIAANGAQGRDMRERATVPTLREERPGPGVAAANPLIALLEEAEREQRRREAAETAPRPRPYTHD